MTTFCVHIDILLLNFKQKGEILLAYTSRFKFIGNLSIPDKDKDSFFKTWEGGKNSDRKMAKMNFYVQESKANSCKVECFGMEYDTLRVGYEDGKPIEVKWADRFDEEIIKEVPKYKKYIVDLDGEEKHFLSQYDFILYLAEVLPKHEGKVECRGRFVKSPYEGEVYDHYELDTVKASTDSRNRLEIEMDLFYNKDCVDLAEYNEKKRIILNAYTKQWMSKDEGEKFFPQKVILDISKALESEDEKSVAFGKLMESKVNVKNSEVIHIPWSCKLIRGAEMVEFDESMLTDAQREQIAYGVATLDEFNRQSYGENIYEMRLIRQELRGDFADGPVDSGLSLVDIENELYKQPVAKETIADIEQAAKATSEDDMDSALEDLLG